GGIGAAKAGPAFEAGVNGASPAVPIEGAAGLAGAGAGGLDAAGAGVAAPLFPVTIATRSFSEMTELAGACGGGVVAAVAPTAGTPVLRAEFGGAAGFGCVGDGFVTADAVCGEFDISFANFSAAVEGVLSNPVVGAGAGGALVGMVQPSEPNP